MDQLNPLAGNLFPRTLEVHVKLDDDPRYKGSIHDNAVARSRGYRAALVPGAFAYGHVSRLAVEAWGMDWIARGGMGARFRRPVYNGDMLTLSASALNGGPEMRRAEVSVANQEGEVVAEGWVGLPDDQPSPPDMEGLVLYRRADNPPVVEAGALVVGSPVTSANKVLTEEDRQVSLRAFGEDHPIYEGGLVHGGCLMRLAMGDTNNSFRFPSPVVLVEAEGQHFAPVRAGQRLATLGRITDTYLRKGKYYFESEEWMIADDRPVAKFRRLSIYGYEAAG